MFVYIYWLSAQYLTNNYCVSKYIHNICIKFTLILWYTLYPIPFLAFKFNLILIKMRAYDNLIRYIKYNFSIHTVIFRKGIGFFLSCYMFVFYFSVLMARIGNFSMIRGKGGRRLLYCMILSCNWYSIIIILFYTS